ncbi:hypothetical protein [Kitasatospora griseola]|uniref:hypothetical protein n=1 Tax=Kitasatospora griseola TaxID=2064 RepID=UPI00380C5A65
MTAARRRQRVRLVGVGARVIRRGVLMSWSGRAPGVAVTVTVGGWPVGVAWGVAEYGVQLGVGEASNVGAVVGAGRTPSPGARVSTGAACRGGAFGAGPDPAAHAVPPTATAAAARTSPTRVLLPRVAFIASYSPTCRTGVRSLLPV